MFYSIVQRWIRLTSFFFFRRIHFSDRRVLEQEGPLLLACNHPNSFLDAIVVASHFKRPVHFLTRGDAFRKPWVRKILARLQMIPIYRLSEGREYLALNDATFDRCSEVLAANGIVLIFAEGLCMHQWLLRNLKKGAARIAIDAWKHHRLQSSFRVLPVSLNYDSFTNFGKRIIIHFGEPIQYAQLNHSLSEGELLNQFNHLLSARLAAGMLLAAASAQSVPFLLANQSMVRAEPAALIHALQQRQPMLESDWQSGLLSVNATYVSATSAGSCLLQAIGILVLAPFACLGWLIHIPFYLPLRRFIKQKVAGTVFYDSVLFGALLLLYPLYWVLINGIALICWHSIAIQFVLSLMPLLAWLLLLWRDCWNRFINYVSLSRADRRRLSLIRS